MRPRWKPTLRCVRLCGGDTGASYNEFLTGLAKASGMDPNSLRAIASIESSMNPDSNRDKATQYKGLFQIGRDEWEKNGQGDIYNPADNAMAMARLAKQNSESFQKHFGHAPTDGERYMMHQQGLGFYTKGTMTNIQGNPYPGMSGPQTHESFEKGWTDELERRKAQYTKIHPADSETAGKIPETGKLAGPAPADADTGADLFTPRDPTSPGPGVSMEPKPAPDPKTLVDDSPSPSGSPPAAPSSPVTGEPRAGSDKSSALDVIDATGPTFGSGKARVPGLDASLGNPWA